MATDLTETAREAQQMETEFCLREYPVDMVDSCSLALLVGHAAVVAGDAGADIEQISVKVLYRIVETAYRLGRASILREWGDVPDDFYQFCSDILGEDIAKDRGDDDLDGFSDYIAGSM